MRTIWWEDGRVILINQRRLPEKLEYIECKDTNRLAEAIKNLEIRGAPAIGVAAAMGLALAAQNSKSRQREELLSDLTKAANELKATRPTARNLFWAIEKILKKARLSFIAVDELKTEILKEALLVAEEDIKTNKMIGSNGATLIGDGDTIGTICNAGWLATAGEYGTALGIIKVAHEEGKKISVIALETRPVLQGARLTAFELKQDKIAVKVIPDSAIGYCFSKGMIDKFICGADRIVVSSGCHVINKIGTQTVSIAAKYYGIPFYVAAPTSTFDIRSKLDEIIIEERDPQEVTEIGGLQITPQNVPVLNPAFDVTPPQLISAIVTEKKIIYPPLKGNIQKLFKDYYDNNPLV